MKRSIDKLTMVVTVVMTLLSLLITGYSVGCGGDSSTLLEIGINCTAVSLTLIIAAINLTEKSWHSAEKYYFNIVLIFVSVLLTTCMVEDLLWLVGMDDLGDSIEIFETIGNAICYYFIWQYIASNINISHVTKKKIDVYQLAMCVLTVAILVFAVCTTYGNDTIIFGSVILISLVNGSVASWAIVKSKSALREAVSLLILALIPSISGVMYHTLLDVFIQYEIDTLALLICFVNVLFTRGMRIEHDREFAARVQISVLPKDFAISDKVEIYAETRAMEQVGGDFYDFCVIDDNHVAFLMADVSGHGAPASMFMMEGISLFRGLIRNKQSIQELMADMNDILCEYNDEQLFITSWFGILDTDTGAVEFIDAGHGMASVISEDGSVRPLKGKTSLALSVMNGVRYRVNEAYIEKGETLFLYTDGVPEAVNRENELFGDERTELTLSRPFDDCRELCENVYEAVNEFRGMRTQEDDITVMAITYKKESKRKTEDVLISHP